MTPAWLTNPWFAYVPYAWLSAALVSLWLVALWRPPEAGGSPGRPAARLAPPGVCMAIAIATGYLTGALSPIAMLPIAGLALLCALLGKASAAPSALLVTLAALGVVLVSLALMAHVVPGFTNLLIVRNAAVSADAVPYTLYLNFDKALIGLFVLGLCHPLIATGADWMAMLRGMLPRALIVVAIVMIGALALGQVHLDLKWPEVLPFFLWSNLLFTCAAEEALFRGVIQRHLAGPDALAKSGGGPGSTSPRAVAALATAAVLFGLVHYAGGPSAIVLATIAGLGYGWVYARTGRIEASILTHFLLNTIHILAFTYPALR